MFGTPSPRPCARARSVRCGVPALALSFTVPFSRSRSPAVPRSGAVRADTHCCRQAWKAPDRKGVRVKLAWMLGWRRTSVERTDHPMDGDVQCQTQAGSDRFPIRETFPPGPASPVSLQSAPDGQLRREAQGSNQHLPKVGTAPGTGVRPEARAGGRGRELRDPRGPGTGWARILVWVLVVAIVVGRHRRLVSLAFIDCPLPDRPVSQPGWRTLAQRRFPTCSSRPSSSPAVQRSPSGRRPAPRRPHAPLRDLPAPLLVRRREPGQAAAASPPRSARRAARRGSPRPRGRPSAPRAPGTPGRTRLRRPHRRPRPWYRSTTVRARRRFSSPRSAGAAAANSPVTSSTSVGPPAGREREVLRHQLVGDRHELAELLARRLGDPDVVAERLRHLLAAVGSPRAAGS